MYMTDEQIYRDYIEAKNPKRQIKILAELNSCPRATIEGIIERESQRREKSLTKIPEAIANPKRKDALSHETKVKMYEDNASGMMQKDIAVKYNRSKSTISTAIAEIRKERELMKFAADIPADEREKITAEAMDMTAEHPAEAAIEETIISDEEMIISRATPIDIARTLMLLIREDFKGYSITIEHSGNSYVVDVQREDDGATIRWKK